MPDQWLRWKNSSAWRAVEQALHYLERAGQLHVPHGTEESVIGAVCASLDMECCLSGSRLAHVMEVFDDVAESKLPGGSALLIALETCSVIENGGGEAELAAYLAEYQREPGVKVLSSAVTVDLVPYAPLIAHAYARAPQ